MKTVLYILLGLVGFGVISLFAGTLFETGSEFATMYQTIGWGLLGLGGMLGLITLFVRLDMCDDYDYDY